MLATLWLTVASARWKAMRALLPVERTLDIGFYLNGG